MKKLTLLLLSLASVCALADSPKPPRGTFSADAYAEVKTRAAAEKKLIVYVWTELDSTCPKCQAGTEAALKAFRSDKKYSVVIGQGKNTDHAPPSIRKQLGDTTTKAGNTIPIVMILNPEDESVLSSACYKQFARDSRIWKKMQKEAETAKGATTKTD